MNKIRSFIYTALVSAALLLSACAPGAAITTTSTATATVVATATVMPVGATAATTNLPAPMGTLPASNPPSSGSSDSASITTTAAYTLDGGSATQTGQTYTATATDETAVYVTNAGQLTLTNAKVWFDWRKADDFATQTLLKSLNPVVDFDKDLGLMDAIKVDKIRLENGVLEATGKTRIPEKKLGSGDGP